MKSPFPGMDPYLEWHWLDLHPRLIVASSRAIQRQLGDDLVARIEERLVVEDTLGYSRPIGPDVRVVAVRPRGGAEGGGTAVMTTARPVHLTEMSEPIRERSIEILDLKTGGRVITIVEFVSPSNKLPGDGRKQYRQKQEECYAARVSLVEIDLTRGERTLLCHRWATARQYESTYQVSVWRAAWASEVDLYPIALHERLPPVPIPLRPGEPEATLDLQAVFEECYADARYDRTVDYAKPPAPPLAGDEAAWAGQLLADRGAAGSPGSTAP
jgi:hypothetical protein